MNQFATVFMGLAKLFNDCDLTLIEINHGRNERGDIHCLDAKLSVDSNALYRQKELSKMRDYSQEDELENQASI